MGEEKEVCKDCEKSVEDYYECDICGCVLCEDCRIDFTTGPGSSFGYCHDCSLCRFCGNVHNMHDDFHCTLCGETGCESCRKECERCDDVFCEECIESHDCSGSQG